MDQSGKDRATLYKHSLLNITKSFGNGSTSNPFDCARMFFVPLCVGGQSIGNLLLLLSFKLGSWCSQLGCDEHSITEHELGLHLSESFLLGKFVPHGAHKGLTCFCSMLESGVEIVNYVVALIDRVSNDSLHSLALIPRLPVNIVDRTVGTEEGIIRTELVKPYPNILRWDA